MILNRNSSNIEEYIQLERKIWKHKKRLHNKKEHNKMRGGMKRREICYPNRGMRSF